MGKIAAYLLVGIGVGFGFAWWQGFGGPAGEIGIASIEDRAPLERRLSELETSLALERYEREVLAEEIAALRAAVGGSASGEDGPAAGVAGVRERIAAVLESDEPAGPVAERVRERFPNGLPQSRDERERMMRERQIDEFVEAGLTPDRAAWILQREDELEMEVLQARYEATQSGAAPEEVANISLAQAMRAELGDSEYEKYLEGRGRPTSITVREVLTNSPASIAGLEAGDEIVAYDGRRVFEMNELTDLTYAARPGGTVPIDVIRDGQRIQVYVESGPIGISGGGRSRRDFGGGRR